MVSEHGSPQVLVASEAPDPAPGPGQALVDVEIANVTFVETQVRAGTAPFPAPALPFIPGNGVGGVVAAVGEGVHSALVGAEVITSLYGSGGYAERATADAAALIAVPDGMAIAEAVALLADGRTAMGLLDSARVQAGETVLVEAAAGGVGSLLVQLAHNAGAEVVAAAGGARKLDLARSLGAEVAVDYTEPGWADRLAEQVGGVAVVFDGVGGDIGRAAFELLMPGGRFCAFGLASGAFADVTDDEAAARGSPASRPGAPRPSSSGSARAPHSARRSPGGYVPRSARPSRSPRPPRRTPRSSRARPWARPCSWHADRPAGLLAVFAFACLVLATRAFRAYQAQV